MHDTVSRRSGARVWRPAEKVGLELRKLERLAVNGVGELETAIHNCQQHPNADPKPFSWTRSAKEIIAKIERGLQTLATVR